MRWHQALRRRIPEAAAESRIPRRLGERRGTTAPDPAWFAVRDLMRGARLRSDPPDPAERVLHGAMAATAATETLGPLLRRAPRQAVARLHLAAAADLLPEEDLGRPRAHGQDCPEFAILGAAPSRRRGPTSRHPRLPSPRPRQPRLRRRRHCARRGCHARPSCAAMVSSPVLSNARSSRRAVSTRPGRRPRSRSPARGSTSYQGALAAYGTGTRAGLSSGSTTVPTASSRVRTQVARSPMPFSPGAFPDRPAGDARLAQGLAVPEHDAVQLT